ncbi:MAG: AAA family ATPase [Prosthecobacter sp.]
MLTEFSIGNYQAFSTPQKVPLKPITLIFGPNSAGKSALLRSLLLARQAIVDETLAKNVGSHERHPGNPEGFVRNKQVPLEVSFTASQESDLCRIDLLWKADGVGNVETHSMKVLRNKEELLRFEGSAETASSDHPSLSQLFERQPEEVSKTTRLTATFIHPEVSEALGGAANAPHQMPDELLKGHACLTPTAALPGSRIVDFLEHCQFPELSDLLGDDVAFSKEGDRLRRKIQDVIQVVRKNVETDLENMVYHGPVRPVPKRLEHADKDIPLLSEWWKLAFDLPPLLRFNPPPLLREVNQWLAGNPHTKRHELVFDYRVPGSRLKNLFEEIGAEVTPDEALEEAFHAKWNSDEKFRDKLVEDHLHATWDDNDPSKCEYDSKEEALDQSYYVIFGEGRERGRAHFDELYQSKGLNAALEFLLAGASSLKKEAANKHKVPAEQADVYFEDVATKTKIPPSNIGIGFSQMLPLVVSAFTCESQLIAIEQPELHIHPALQTELADLFIQSAKKRGNRYLIETHSEHLILRVMRRIRETFEGRLPEGKHPITSDEVCVLYVEPGENGSVVREMPLNERGELIKGWPGGFFEEALNEMF